MTVRAHVEPSAPRAVETKPYGHAFADFAERNTDVVCVTNDLTASCEADIFRERLPERYFSLGMAEQNLVGVLGGLAREGLVPFFPTFGVFATRRPYEQIALAVAYPALKVRLMGFLPGLTTPGGVTHQSTDDIALMVQLPNMTVLEVGDAVEARTVLDVMADVDGPVYCRMLRGEVPVLFDSPMRLNSSRELARGDELLVLSCGVQTDPAAQLVEALQRAGVEVGHLHISTLKPFTDELVRERLSTARAVLTIENHLVRGGLGTNVAEVIAEHHLSASLTRVGVRDTFTHGGTRDYLFDFYDLGPAAVMDAIEAALGRTVFDRDDKSGAERLQHHAAAVAEGL